MKKILRQEKSKDNMYDYKKLIIIMVAFCIVSAVGAILYGLMWIRIVIAVAVLVAMIIKRNYFIDMYRKIKGNN